VQSNLYCKTVSMKASELRIGNWVKVPTTDGSDVFTQIEPSNFCHEWNSEISIESYNPIPLTEEWLVKFGFVRIKSSSPERWRKPDQINFKFGKWKSSCGIFMKGCNGLGRNIDHVHQLQNLYFALTGEELTLKEKP